MQLAIIPKLFVVCIFLSPIIALATSQFAYVGTDIGLMYCNMQQNYGRDIFSSKPLTQGTVFAGLSFAPWLGFELGYEKSFAQLESVFVPPAMEQFGIPNFTTISSSVYNTKKSLQGFNLLYAARLQLYKNLYIMPMLGAVNIKSRVNLYLTEFDGASSTDAEQQDYDLSFATNKMVPKIALRLQYAFDCNLCLHIYTSWEQTSKIQMQTTRNIFTQQILTAKLKNTTNIGVGLLYRIKFA